HPGGRGSRLRPDARRVRPRAASLDRSIARRDLRLKSAIAAILLVTVLGGPGCGTGAREDAPPTAGAAPATTGAPAKAEPERDETVEAPALPEEVDATSLEHKMLFGYQGWFLCPGDGSPANRWTHWFRNDAPTAANLTIDLWPDTSELGADELCPTGLAYGDGSV